MFGGKPLKVLVDTNFLMVPVRFGVDVESELGRVLEASFRMVTTCAVVDELERLKAHVKQGKLKEIDFALAAAEKLGRVDDALLPGEEVDDQLLRVAVRERYVVATLDSELRKRLRAGGVPVVYLRRGHVLALDGLV